MRINKPNIQKNIIVISSFKTGPNDLFSSTGFYFKSKVIEGSHKKKNVFLNFWALFLKIYIFDILLLPSYPINSVFQWQYVSIRFHVFHEAVFLLTIKMPIVTKRIRVVTCCEGTLTYKYAWHLNGIVSWGYVANKMRISTYRRCVDLAST